MEPSGADRRYLRSRGGLLPLSVFSGLVATSFLSPSPPRSLLAAPPLTPASLDADLDGMPDGLEIQYGTNPLKADTDNDGFVDLEEFVRRSDPLSAASSPTGTASATRVFIFAPTIGVTDKIALGVAIYFPPGALAQPGTFAFGLADFSTFTSVLDTAMQSNDVSFAFGSIPGSLVLLLSLPLNLPSGYASLPAFNLAAGGVVGGTLTKDAIYVGKIGGVPGTYEVQTAATAGSPATAAFRPIDPTQAPAGSTFGVGCMVTMEAGGSSNGYVVVEVTDADCEPFPGFCSASDCSQQLGSAHLVFDLLGVIGG